MAKACQATHDPLYPLQVSDRPHPLDGLDFLRVGFDASLRDDETQEHSSRYSEHAFFLIELYPLGSKAVKRDFEISYHVVCLPGFYDDVVDICFYVPPDMVPEHVEHTPLVCDSGVSKAKWHRDIVVHAEGCDKRSCELVRLFHLYLVVTGVSIKKG